VRPAVTYHVLRIYVEILARVIADCITSEETEAACYYDPSRAGILNYFQKGSYIALDQLRCTLWFLDRLFLRMRHINVESPSLRFSDECHC
jgi:hypothetical protein